MSSEYSRTLTIGDREIGDHKPTYVIAEIGHNHQGNVDQAMQLIDEARRAGAHAVKTQKRDNRSLYTREMFDKPYENENSFGASYGEHREALEFGRAEYEELIAYSKRQGDDRVLVVVNLDPVHAQSGFVDVDLAQFGLDAGEAYEVLDHLSGARYTWYGARNFVQLDPARAPAHLFAVA